VLSRVRHQGGCDRDAGGCLRIIEAPWGLSRRGTEDDPMTS
jgi:hypothetical protein